jgi:Molybdopterin cofactor-binding domain
MYAAMLSKRLTPPSSRRNFLTASAAGAGALIIGCAFGEGAQAKEAANGNKAGIGPKASPMPDAFIRIAPDDSVTVLIKHLDMGQGVTTGLTTIVAEELDADWSQMRAEFAPANAKLYNNLAFGPMQGTGGSTSRRKFVGSVAIGGGRVARHARRGRGGGLESSRFRDHGSQGPALPSIRQVGLFRPIRGESGARAFAQRRYFEGSCQVRIDRRENASDRFDRKDDR